VSGCGWKKIETNEEVDMLCDGNMQNETITIINC